MATAPSNAPSAVAAGGSVSKPAFAGERPALINCQFAHDINDPDQLHVGCTHPELPAISPSIAVCAQCDLRAPIYLTSQRGSTLFILLLLIGAITAAILCALRRTEAASVPAASHFPLSQSAPHMTPRPVCVPAGAIQYAGVLSTVERQPRITQASAADFPQKGRS